MIKHIKQITQSEALENEQPKQSEACTAQETKEIRQDTGYTEKEQLAYDLLPYETRCTCSHPKRYHDPLTHICKYASKGHCRCVGFVISEKANAKLNIAIPKESEGV